MTDTHGFIQQLIHWRDSEPKNETKTTSANGLKVFGVRPQLNKANESKTKLSE